MTASVNNFGRHLGAKHHMTMERYVAKFGEPVKSEPVAASESAPAGVVVEVARLKRVIVTAEGKGYLINDKGEAEEVKILG